MKYYTIPAAGFALLFVVVMSLYTGYQLGSTAENSTELNRSIDEIKTNFSETAENELTPEPYSELEDRTDIELLRPLEKTYYNTVIKPTYWFGRNMLEYSGMVIEWSARISYRYL